MRGDLRERALEDQLVPVYATAGSARAAARLAAQTDADAAAPLALAAAAYFVWALAYRFVGGLAVVFAAFSAYSLFLG